MTDKITLEDINTWIMKYQYQTLVLNLDCSTIGDYGFYEVDRATDSVVRAVWFYFYCENIKLYYPSGRITRPDYCGRLRLTNGDFQLTLVLNSINNEGIEIGYGDLDWYPVSPLKCLSLPDDDLTNKLYLDIKDNRITHINNVEIQDLTGEPYVPYNVITEGSLSTNVSGTTVYPAKLITIPSCPPITIEKELYKGNNNSLDDLISLPSDDIEYKIYYNGKELKDNIFIPRDYDEDTIHLRVVTKSYEPYIGTDVFIDVPVTRKLLTTLEDLNTYSYGRTNGLSNITGEINNDITIISSRETLFDNCNLTINGNVIIKNPRIIRDTKITNNGYLELIPPTSESMINIRFQDGEENFKWVNNGELIIDRASIDNNSGFVLNNGEISIINSEIDNISSPYALLPFCHSTTDTFELKNNTFLFNDVGYSGYDLCIIRCNNFDADKFISENTTDYDCIYINDNKTYAITGNGVAYCLIDEDTLRFKNLEVNENV